MDLITVDDYMQAPIVPPDFAYRYGDDPNQFGELFLPESDDSFPVIIMLHGGCWREQYGLKPIGSMCRTLADEGFAVWNIEYRRAGNGGDYPNMFLDVAHAADS